MQKLRILIVEDEGLVAADLEARLTRLGYTVTAIVDNGPEALRAARKGRPDLALMDIQLLGPMDGIRVAGELRQACRVPVVFLTGHADQSTLERACATEPFGYLVKPFEEPDLVAAIETASYRHRAEERLRQLEQELERANQKLQRANARLEQRVLERTAQLRALARRLVQSEERERRRIAEVLHEDLQQLLVGARCLLKLGRECPDSEPTALPRVDQLLEKSIDVARRLSHELSAFVLHKEGLAAALQRLAGWMREHQQLTVRVQADAAAEPTEEDLKVLLFYAVRELLLNVVKHAGVKRAAVRMTLRDDEQLELLVSDQGRGFDPARTRTGRKTSSGFGLFSIHERLQWLGGRMEVQSAPGRGSRFRLIVPVGALLRRKGAPGFDEGL